MRQAGKMRETAGDRGLMPRRLQHRRDLLAAGRSSQVLAPVKDAVLGVHRLGVVVGPGIGARRMAGDQIVDFQPVFYGTDAIRHRCAAFSGFTHFESLSIDVMSTDPHAHHQ